MDDLDQIQKLEQDVFDKRLQALRSTVKADPDQLGAEFCEECDSPIPMARRKAVPTCTLCIDCKTAMEKGLL